jgi:hypothetical protein
MRIFIGFVFLGLLISCGEKKKDIKSRNSSKKQINSFFENEEAYENEVLKIDSDKSLLEVTSLEYLSNEGQSLVAKALVESKNDGKSMIIKKLTCKQISQNGIESTYSFYYLGIRKFASTCEKSFLQENEMKKFVTKSYYDDSSHVFFSKRLAISSETSNLTKYSKCKPTNHDDKRALRIINQEGEFETNFQGFTENLGRSYLILGTDYYTSTVAFDVNNPSLDLLKKNEKKYLGKKLIVDFFVTNDNNGFTYQALNNLSVAP